MLSPLHPGNHQENSENHPTVHHYCWLSSPFTNKKTQTKTYLVGGFNNNSGYNTNNNAYIWAISWDIWIHIWLVVDLPL